MDPKLTDKQKDAIAQAGTMPATQRRRAADTGTQHETELANPLVELADALATQSDVQTFLQALHDAIGRLIRFDTVSVMLYDAEKGVMRGYAVGTLLPTTFRPGNEYALDDCPQGTVWRTQEPIQIVDLRHDHRFVHSKRLVMESGLQSYWVLPLTTARVALGALAFGSQQLNGFSDCDADLVCKVARLVAVSIESAVNAEQCTLLQGRTEQQRDQLAALLDVTNNLVAARGLEAVLRNTSACLHRLVKHDASSFNLFDPVTGKYQVMSLDERMNGKAIARFVDYPPAGSAFSQLLETRAPFSREQLDTAEFPDDTTVARVVARGFVSVCSVPILTPERVIGVLSMGRRRREAFTADEVELLTQAGRQLVLAVENAVALDEIRSLKDKLAEENRYLAEEIRTVHNFDEIVGNSVAAGARSGQHRRTDRFNGIDRGRDRDRQGTHRPCHPRPQPAPRTTVDQGELRGHPGGPDRERTVRPRKGRLHRRGRATQGQVRTRQRRHDFSGRDWRHAT
jgi:formate hydrogenlyase transcriptional activator